MLGKFCTVPTAEWRKKIQQQQQATFTYIGSGYRISRARWHCQQRITRSTFLFLLSYCCCYCCCDSIFSTWKIIRCEREAAAVRAKSASNSLLCLWIGTTPKRTIYEKRKIYVNTQHAPNSPYYTYNLCCLFAQGILMYVWVSEQVYLFRILARGERKLNTWMSIHWMMLCQR